ncbi:MAG: Mur ligase family protein [Bacteriovoracaceae bacterium]
MIIKDFIDLISPYVKEVRVKDKDSHLAGIVDYFQEITALDAFYLRTIQSDRPFHHLEKLKTEPRLIITHRDSDKLKSFNNVVILDKEIEEAEYLPLIANQFYKRDETQKIIGVTGTNGKSSIVHFLNQIATASDKQSASIGTLGLWNGNIELRKDVYNSSPSYLFMRKIFHENSNLEYFFTELTSHALEQKRFLDIRLDGAIWTNLTQDHLDFHKTFENYFHAKMKISNYLKEKAKLFVLETEESLLEMINQKSFKKLNVVKKEAYKEVLDSVPRFKVGFMRKNMALSLALLDELNIYDPNDSTLLQKIEAPKGRLEELTHQNLKVVIDYAHTPDALQKLLEEMKLMYPEKKIHTLFGCGGDRDKTKREIMGEIASSHSDMITVTSDNPRTEDPGAIINDIAKGIDNPNLKMEPDRRKAIEESVKTLNDTSILVIAGKGHEDYQEINGVKKDFSDHEVVKKAFDAFSN